MLRDTYSRNADSANRRLFCPDETNSNRLGAVFEVDNRCFVGKTLPHRPPRRTGRQGNGGLKRAPLRGLARGLPPDRAPRPLCEFRGLCHDPGLHDGPAHQVARGGDQPLLAGDDLLAQHPPNLHRLAQRPQRVLAPGARLDRRNALQEVALSRASTCPDANTLLACADHCLRSRNYVNLIAIDKQPQLQWLDMDAAIDHLALGTSMWEWASNGPEGEEPDIVLGFAGEIPPLETVAAAHWLRENAPELKVRGSVLRAGWR